ncbi:MAG: alpha/beta hydrolase [Desulfobacterales bacterium]|nr:alpha/beta hydrolase [Desulfobacterales bacterium]
MKDIEIKDTEISKKRPSKTLLFLEVRALLELAAYFIAMPLLQMAPKGNGEPVMVIPGFTAGDWATLPMRKYLTNRGYSAHGWGLGINLGYSEELDQKLSLRLIELYKRYGKKINLIGWSLGGTYARELARWSPDLVRCVMTIGSPFAMTPKATNVWQLYEYLSGEKIDEMDKELFRRMQSPPPVPTTSIFSSGDGVVPPECSLECSAAHTENIHVYGSHCGLPHNPFVLWVIADRLAQHETEWKPFDWTKLRSILFPMQVHPKRLLTA